MRSGKNTKRSTRNLILLILAVLAHLVYFFKSNYVINLTPSMTPGIYRTRELTPISKGDVVIIEVPENVKELMYEREYIKPNISTLLKRVVGVPGDQVKIKDRKLYINGHFEKNINPLDSKGRPLSYREYNKKLKEGEYIVLGDNREKSYDSGYFGSVSKETFISKAKLSLEIKKP